MRLPPSTFSSPPSGYSTMTMPLRSMVKFILLLNQFLGFVYF